MNWKLSFFAFFVFVNWPEIIDCIPIDNGVNGSPKISCNSNSIGVNFTTKNNFEGHIFVKGFYNTPECRTESSFLTQVGIQFSIEACGTRRTRTLNPAGLSIEATVIISFHPQFLTKVDGAYRIQCFYMEAEKTVTAGLEISDLTTGAETVGQTVQMPVCRYEILQGSSTGPPIRYAKIGDQVYHKWTCDTETANIFCMTVHSCFVDDGQGNKANLLDEQGCAMDRFLLQNLEYTTDLMAGKESHVFKYADRPQLYFQCQVSVTLKEENAACVRASCSEEIPRGKRSLPNQEQKLATMDVNAPDLYILDIQTHELNDSESHPEEISLINNQIAFTNRAVCFTPGVFGIIIGINILFFISILTAVLLLLSKRKKNF